MPALSGVSMVLMGCQGLQFNLPVEVQTLRREEAALLVLLENRSTLLLRVLYPVQSGMLRPSQHVIFPLPQPGNHRVVVAAYREGRRLPHEYRPVASLELPVFLNGHDVFQVKGRFVGHHIEVTDGMLVPYREGFGGVALSSLALPASRSRGIGGTDALGSIVDVGAG